MTGHFPLSSFEGLDSDVFLPVYSVSLGACICIWIFCRFYSNCANFFEKLQTMNLERLGDDPLRHLHDEKEVSDGKRQFPDIWRRLFIESFMWKPLAEAPGVWSVRFGRLWLMPALITA